MEKSKRRTKILISAILLGVFLIGAIVSIVLVLAASTQNVASNITVSYNAEGVAAKVSANYAVVPNSGAATKTAMTTSGGGQEIVFNLSTSESTETIAPSENIVLNPQNQTVVFEYVFENLADTAFSLSLSQRPTGTNMTEKFLVSGVALDPSDYASAITGSSLATQAVTYLGQKVYVYIMASVANENLTASYNGGFAWNMVAQTKAAYSVTLNNGTGTGGMTTLPVISTTTVSGIMMPTISTIPTLTRYKLAGYYSAANGTGTQYYDGNGTPLLSAVTSATTLYAHYVQVEEIASPASYFNMSDTTITSVSTEGATQTKLVIPSTVTEIGESAFANNTTVEEITYEGAELKTESYADSAHALTTIGATAFSGCTKLKKIVIPGTVTSIGTTILSGCTAVEELEYPYVLGSGTLSANGLSELFGRKNSAIPATLTTVTINGGTSIGNYAFSNCSGLTSITIPNSVTNIGNYAFSSCSGLTSIEIPNSVTSIGSRAFSDCSGLTSITIPNSVTSIGNYAFSNCSGLTSIEIPNSVTSIGSGAFQYCSGLTSIEVAEGNTTYNSGNGSNCIIETATNTLIAGFKTTTIPNSVTSIGNSAFQYCSGLTSIEIPNSVTSIDNYAFSSCSGLTSIEIPNSVTRIGDNAFFSCSGLTSITIPNSVTSIGNYAFSNCSGLTSITIPNSVKSIGNQAFQYCSGLTSVTIPNSVTSIGNYAFAYCSGLTSVTFENPNNWVVSTSSTFSSTTSLTSTDLSNTSTAATYLKTTYYNYYWKRTA